jgi:hypothetical protein
MMEQQEGVCVTLRDGWEAIVHFDETEYNIGSKMKEKAKAFQRSARYKSGNIISGNLRSLKLGEVTFKINPARKKSGTINLEQLADRFIQEVILPAKISL